MNESLISIIVPVYKVEPYIRKCVDSILGQTHRNIEVFLVDDGSPDNCGAICDEYAKADGRITVIHKENGGQSTARNMALDLVKGDYIMFVDSDDWVEPDFCESALKAALENDVQMVAFGYNLVFMDKNGTITEKQPAVYHPTGIMDASEGVRHMILRDTVIGNYLMNKLFKRSLLDGVRLPVGRFWEDHAVIYRAMLNAGKLYVSDAVLYNYLQRPDSSMGTTEFTPRMYADLFAVWNERLPVIKQYSPENEQYQIMEMGDVAVSGLVYIHPDSEYGYALDEMKDFLTTHKDSLLHGNAKKTAKLKLRLYYYCLPLLPLIKYARAAKQFLTREKA